MGTKQDSELVLCDDSSAIGKIALQSEGAVVLGDFVPFNEFSKYSELFKNYESAANGQELTEIDRLDKIINGYRFKVIELDNSNVRFIKDLQIVSGGVSFRWVD